MYFFQFRWRSFEIPKASQKKVHFVSVKSMLSTPSHFSPLFHGEWSSHLQPECQAEAALEAGNRHSTTCLCFGAGLRMSFLQGPYGPQHQRVLHLSKQITEIKLLFSSGSFVFGTKTPLIVWWSLCSQMHKINYIKLQRSQL